jgi:tetratricopeptide (TPR) repeat protein
MTQPRSSSNARLSPPSAGLAAACVCLGLMLVVGAAFWPILNAGFIEPSDQHYLFEVGRVRETSWRDFVAAFQRLHLPAGSGPEYAPLTTVSLKLDALTIGDWRAAAFHFHLTNLALHVLNVALLYFLLCRRHHVGHGEPTLRTAEGGCATQGPMPRAGSLLWAAIGALIFGLHPVQVESVAWIAQRGMLLGTTFSLLTLLCYSAYAAGQRIRWLVPVTLGYAAVVLSKPIFIALPVVLLVLDMWPLRRMTWRPIVDKIPLLAVMAVCWALHYYLRAHAEPAHAASSGGLRLMAANLAALTERLFWPVRLTPFSPYLAGAVQPDWRAAADLLIVALPAAGLIAAFRFSRPAFVGLAGAVILVLPAMFNLPFSGKVLGDYCLYAALIVPLIAWCAWVKERGSVLRQAWGRCTALGLSAAVLVLGVRANIQTYYWHDIRELFRRTISLYPGWAGGYVGLIESYIREGDLDSALHCAEQAVREMPGDPSTQFYLGRVLLLHQDGRSVEAIGPLRRALASDPDWIDCLHNLGTALLNTGQVDEAIERLDRARELQPRSAAIRIDLGRAYLQARRPASARGEFQAALEERNDPLAHLGLAEAWAAADMPELARRHLAAAVAVSPRYAVLAGQCAELRRLRDAPGFESLIDVSGGSSVEAKDLGLPPARSGPGM